MRERKPLEFRGEKKYPEEISWFFSDEDGIKTYVELATERCLGKDRAWQGISIGTRPFIKKIIELAAEERGQRIVDIDKLEKEYHSDFFRVISGLVGELRKSRDRRDADFTGEEIKKTESKISGGRPFKDRGKTKGAGTFIEKSQP